MTLPSLSASNPAGLREALRLSVQGRVTGVAGLVVEGSCAGAAVGELVEIRTAARAVAAEVIGLRDERVLMIPLGDVRGIGIGDALLRLRVPAQLECGDGLLGRVVDARGQPLDGEGPITGSHTPQPLYADPPPPLSRRLIDTACPVGIRAIDAALTLGRGQRVGIMAGAGVGKSRLLADLVTGTTADVAVVALIGERGREVGEFLERTLTKAARRKTVAVVATSDQSPLLRMRGAFAATAVAEHFSDRGADVLLVMDSLTRFAMAQREIGLSVGEPPATRGYTPSVFATLPRLLERAGRFARGSITGLYTVLVEGDDLSDPVGDAARSILDGHIVLSRALASRGHFPAIDVLASVSRVQDAVVPKPRAALAGLLRRVLADLAEADELMTLGAYVAGANPALDRALARKQALLGFLRQESGAPTPFDDTTTRLQQLLEGLT
ncbi:MAG: FliI/YscN family ATPase [Deltaproteobacteria bacterium]|nr:FliI/YscN family ATPase [Deltaproteobacteria bacterium]MBK8237920.1 FliI/YscN family ATPase [Deltaproteobacteria bacterium]MBP7290213.1 FliI/YscN family ATPase [Nannocystaceae bacterium]